MAWYDEASEVPRSGSSVKIAAAGRFTTKIDKIRVQESQQGFGDVFVVEFSVLDSSTDTVPPGGGYAWTQFPESGGPKGKMAQANIASFIAACHGRDPVEGKITGDEISAAFDGELDGTELQLRTKMIETKSGYPYCVHSWAPVAGSSKQGDLPIPTVPPAPPAPKAELTKEAWLNGEGPAKVHPQNPSYEYHPAHPEWGVREVSGIDDDLPF